MTAACKSAVALADEATKLILFGSSRAGRPTAAEANHIQVPDLRTWPV